MPNIEIHGLDEVETEDVRVQICDLLREELSGLAKDAITTTYLNDALDMQGKPALI